MYVAFNDDGMTKIGNKATHIFKIERIDGKWLVTEIIYQFDNGGRERVRIADEIKDPEEAKEEMKALRKFLGQEQNQSEKFAPKRIRHDKKKPLSIPPDDLSGDNYQTVSLDDLSENMHPIDETPIFEEVERQELRLILENAIDQISVKQQRVIRLKYFEDVQPSEIAKIVGVDKSAISHLEKRALKNLRKILTERQLSA